eukprot:UN0424
MTSPELQRVNMKEQHADTVASLSSEFTLCLRRARYLLTCCENAKHHRCLQWTCNRAVMTRQPKQWFDTVAQAMAACCRHSGCTS